MENFKNVFNNLSIPTMVVNKECDLIAINKNMFSLCNNYEIELNSTKCYELFHNTDNLCRTGSQTCPVEKVFTAGESHRTILKHSTTKGEIIHEVLATPIFDEHGKIEYAIAEYHSGIQEFRGLISMCS
ncbi:MAG: PAS domain-containing protein, partial [Colwellia sp.]|nr:PAS domain-containing protein [Colwellia sp.]